MEEILENYPQLTREDIQACLGLRSGNGPRTLCSHSHGNATMTNKFKLDENFGHNIQRIFQDRGLDADTVRDEKLQGANDPRVLQAAIVERRILVTLDQDFGNVLMFPPEKTEGIAVIRFPGRATPELLEILISNFIDAMEKKLIKGKLWIVEPGRIREHQTDSWLDEDD